MPNLMKSILGRVFPKPEDGNACTEAAFDKDLMPTAMRQKLQEAEQCQKKQPEKRSVELSP